MVDAPEREPMIWDTVKPNNLGEKSKLDYIIVEHK